tara:strand:- start:227 stop:1291 length:1065 start_codon:yes stop_codon:yes gene_type:complete
LVSINIRENTENGEKNLSPFASKSKTTLGRKIYEDDCDIRTAFQRDRDRIIHSNSFKRLKDKTQVFISPKGDHYITRLTHTLEVAQIARTISRALKLNEDLTEAISLGHDLGHTPFGHIGEDELNNLLPTGFTHAKQSHRIVDLLEKNGEGLNLTQEVKEGILNHSKPKGDFFDKQLPTTLSLEAQVCRISDAIAYLNHDLKDALRNGIINMQMLPIIVGEDLGETHSIRINTMVKDIISTSWSARGDGLKKTYNNNPKIQMSNKVKKALNIFRDYMFQEVYEPQDKSLEGQAARKIVNLLFTHFHESKENINNIELKKNHTIIDYIAGMTDQFAIRTAKNLNPLIIKPLTRKY